MTGIERSGNSMEARLLYDAELQSEIEDVDVIKVVSDLAREETVLRSSLAASKKLLQPTLLDFLR